LTDRSSNIIPTWSEIFKGVILNNYYCRDGLITARRYFSCLKFDHADVGTECRITSCNMSKFTLAVVAASSAFAGATMALLYANKPKEKSPIPTVSKAPMPIAPVDPNGVFAYGFPGPHADLRLASSLVSSYDRRLRNPYWVAEHITRDSLALKLGDRKGSVFFEDASIPEQFRAKLKDYFRSGYDRGHQVPAADAKWSQQAMDDTFALSNIVPQVGDGFNRDYWAHFEDFCRRLTVQYPSIRVITGPLYLPKKDVDGKWRVSFEMIGSPPSVAVPTHCFKVIYAEDGTSGGNVAVAAFVLPNAPIPNDKPLKDFEVPLEAIERASGLEFISKLPVERKKRLCDEAPCDILVKEYKERQKMKF
jgi:endonuclease G, mitochondrial